MRDRTSHGSCQPAAPAAGPEVRKRAFACMLLELRLSGNGMATSIDRSDADGASHGRGPRRAVSPPVVLGADGVQAFPPIADYAFLSDCEAMALVAPSGDVEWLC